MSISSIEELMATARKDRLDPEESQDLLIQVEGYCRDFQRNKIKAGISFYLIERYELYKIEGEKDTRALLKSWGFSDGAISHGMAYGEFCCLLKFKDNQIPPEYVVRSLLVQELKSDWVNIYRAACTLSLKKHVMSEAEMSSGKSAADRGMTGDDDDDEQASENEPTPAQNTAAEEAPPQSDEVKEDGEESNDNWENGEENGKEDGEEDEPPNENSLPLLEYSESSDILLSNKPTIAELKQAIREYKKRDRANIHLFSIHEKMPREGDFASAVLEKFKKKLTTVSVLCRVVRDYKTGGGNLTENDTEALRNFCAEIHDREDKRLENAINGVPDDGSGEVSVNEEPEE